jgi:hypothetical protein
MAQQLTDQQMELWTSAVREADETGKDWRDLVAHRASDADRDAIVAWYGAAMEGNEIDRWLHWERVRR